MKIKQPELRRARIEIIPMIDTIFFLLVFFMITWLAMIKMNGMGMLMPRPATPGAKAPSTLTLSLAETGQYYVNAHRILPTALNQTLRQQLTDHPSSLVVINVAPAQKTQTLISLLDSVNTVIKDIHSSAQVLIATPQVSAAKPEVGHAPK